MKPTIKPFVAGKVFKYAHIKRDGHFTNIIKSAVNGKVVCYSSQGTDLTPALGGFLPQWRAFQSLPRGASLLGELWLKGCRAADIKTAIAWGNTSLQFHCFAINSWPHNTGPIAIENWTLEYVADLCDQFKVPFVPYFRLRDMRHAMELMEAIKGPHCIDAKGTPARINGILLDDVEGLVFKNANLADWHKWKPRKTIDVIIKGYQGGAGKYVNMLGAIIVQTTEGYEIANVSGMTDAQRKHISERSAEFIGKIIEVEYQDVGNNGRLRHPSFIGYRDDKRADQCSVSQDPDLQLYWEGKTPLFK